MFRYMSYEEINEAALELHDGKYAQVQTAESYLSVKAARDSDGSTCSPFVIRVSHIASLDADKQRPQMFISGEIHGDEKVGPLASLFTAQMLVLSARCELDKDMSACKRLHREFKVGKQEIAWMTLLVSRRDILIIPTVNCLGYMKGARFDNGVDPNRDFPYVTESSKCLQSTTANIVVELFRLHIIQSVVTFHAGMTAIGYEWGSKNHLKPNDKSPDDASHADIASMMSKFGGAFDNHDKYRVQPINSIVYPVWGGMEDWMYASAWDKANVKQCASPLMSSTASESDGRAVVFLVETSDEKIPPVSSLGKATKFLKDSPSGHISRNARLSLAAADMLQPYVCLEKKIKVKKLLADRSSEEDKDRRLSLSSGRVDMKVKWYVGGGFKVDATHLSWLAPRLSWKQLFDCRAEQSSLLDAFPVTERLLAINGTSQTGSTRWTNSEPLDPEEFSAVVRVKPLLSNSTAEEGVTLLAPGDHWLVMWASVDRAWGLPNQGVPVGLPMSHIANARTNTAWRESERESRTARGRQVRGRVFWPSDPVLVRVSPSGEVSVESQVVDCAWWSRTYHPELDMDVRGGDKASPGALQSSDSSLVSKSIHILHDALDSEEWFDRLSHSGLGKTAGLLICICWLAVFGCLFTRCQKRRAYAKFKRSDDIEIV